MVTSLAAFGIVPFREGCCNPNAERACSEPSNATATKFLPRPKYLSHNFLNSVGPLRGNSMVNGYLVMREVSTTHWQHNGRTSDICGLKPLRVKASWSTTTAYPYVRCFSMTLVCHMLSLMARFSLKLFYSSTCSAADCLQTQMWRTAQRCSFPRQNLK